MRSLALLACCVAVALAYSPSHYGDDWQHQPAATKSSVLTGQCTADQTPYGWYSKIRLAELFVESMQTSFDSVSDDMPMQSLGIEERPKLIHSVGVVADIEYVSVGSHSYTGIFKGCKNAIIRFSAAQQPKANPPNVTPGIAIKFLRDQVPSGNIFAMYSLEGQSSFNFFEHDLTNHVPNLNDATAPLPLRLIKQAFMKASAWPTLLGSRSLAEYDEFGNAEPSPRFPFRLVFHPVTAVHRNGMDPSPVDDDQYFIGRLSGKKFNQLYEVWAQDVPTSDNLVKIGQVNMLSAFTGSNYGDKHMFFQHSRFERDLEIYPQWEEPARDIVDNQATIDHYTFPDLPWQ